MKIRVDIFFALGQYACGDFVCEEADLLEQMKFCWAQGFSVGAVEVVPDVTPLKKCPAWVDIAGYER